MKIWRRENTKILKNLKNEKAEEFTDISLSSTPRNNDNKKDKMEEIYSTKEKQVKYKRQTPLEAEEAAIRAQQTKEKLQHGEAEIELDAPENADKIVELTSDYEEGTVIADDIIEDVKEFSKERSVHLEDINEIDVDIDGTDALKKYERQKNSTTRHDERVKRTYENEFERLFGKPKYDVNCEKVVAKIPTYQHDSKVNLINLKAGRFSEVVESEYDEYLKSINPTAAKRKKLSSSSLSQKVKGLSSSAKRTQDTDVEDTSKKQKKPKNKVSKFFRIIGVLLFHKNPDPKKSVKETPPTPVVHKSEDAKQVEKQTKSNYKHLLLRGSLFSVFFIATLTLSIMLKAQGDNIFSGIPFSGTLFCGINLLILLLCGVAAWPFLTSGLKPLKQFKGNSDTAISCAYIACIIQYFAAIFAPDSFLDSSMHLYAPIVTLALTMNTIGRMLMVLRVKSNFDYIHRHSPDHVAKIFNDPETSRKMLSGTTASRSVIAYQNKTNHLSDFLKISYVPDPSEELCTKLAPITIVSSLFVAIVYGIMAKTLIGALSALAVMCCVSIPMCALIVGNLGMFISGKDNLRHNAVISGYPSVKQFSECDAIMINAYDLYPKGSIKLVKSKNFIDFRLEESLLCAARVMKDAKSPLSHIFDDLLKKHVHNRMKVESVLYEDKLGLVGWINGERILIGNRKLLDRFHIYIDDAADETKYTNKGLNVTYIACAGQLVSMLVTSYRPDPDIKTELLGAQANGLCFVVSTTDHNITAERISSDYDIFYRTIKILPSGYATTCNELADATDEASRAYIATNGGFKSFIHAVTSCISFKQNLTISMIVQIFGLILGVLLCATMVLYNSASILGVIEIMLYMLFWGIATVAVQFIKRH